jgi:ADP-ribose pyrophosphatase
VKQFRYPVNKAYWEFPQGSYEENPDINPIELAKGELKEETGLSANKMREIGFLYEAYGFSNQGFHIFLAEDLKRGEQKPQAGEQGMQVSFFTLDQFEQMIDSGEIIDAPSISAYGLLKVQRVI